MIEEVLLRRLAIPLRTPYKLSLGSIAHFDTILVRIATRGHFGFGEATILTGYTHETIDASWTRAIAVARRLPRASPEAATATIAQELADAPFTATALVTAIEMSEGNPLLDIRRSLSIPIVAGLNAAAPAEIEEEIESCLAAGFRTLKMKVGFGVDDDLSRVSFVQRCSAGRAQLRIDANQGYSREDGCRFAASLDPAGIELVEQPCDAADWDAAAAVIRAARVPIMLDESIYDEKDIERAAEIGARLVKLKLMKLGGLDRLDRALRLIRDLGMEPVLGNGVASEIGCWMEACIAPRHLRNAGEMNGFLRQAAPLVEPPIAVRGGAIQLTTDLPLGLHELALARVTVDSARFDR